MYIEYISLRLLPAPYFMTIFMLLYMLPVTFLPLIPMTLHAFS